MFQGMFSKDMNQEMAPIFFSFLVVNILTLSNAQIVFEVKEEQNAPVFLGNIANKARITSIPDLDFSLLNRKDLFDVDEASGDLTTKVMLDREKLCGSVPSCIIATSIAVSSAPDFFQRYSIHVIVLDINDQKPNFGIASFPRSLSERANINTTIKLPVAYDGDYDPAFKVQKYNLELQAHETFDLVVQRYNNSDSYAEFDLHLRLLRKIDREAVGSYTLTLVASDGGTPSNEGRLQVIISITDENDNKPEFQEEEYKISVMEVVQVGSTVLNVTARDTDDGENGRVGYEFSNDVDRKVVDYFEIDRGSGGVTVMRSLEKEGGTTFSFKIRAFDHGTPLMFSEANVKLFVEDTVNNPPSINISQWRSKNGSAVVFEDAVVGTKVAIIDVLDSDSGANGETHCTATSQYFTLEKYNSPMEYTVSVARDLDREKTQVHSILIICVDRGTPPLSSTASLSVVVEDVNDNRPVFTRSSYEMKVKESQDVGQQVGSVFATDADNGLNAAIRYSLEIGVAEFEINESNGYIYTSAKDLDRETRDKYIIKVYAYDTGLFPMTATATVTVYIEDINDEYPIFDNSTYTFLVSESVEQNSVIGQLFAIDLDLGLDGVLEYNLVHVPLYPDPPFALSKDSGVLTVTHRLDYEATRQYNFIVTATDLGTLPKNSSVEIQIQVIDENDNTPVIVFPNKDNLSLVLNLDVARGHEVIKVIAHDPDNGENGRLTYSFSDPESQPAKYFWINKDTGLLTLIASLTEADVRSYNISVTVSDNGFPQRMSNTVLQVEIVHQTERRSSEESYILIVIIMVSATLFVAVVVLIIFCVIKYIDNNKFSSERNECTTFDPINRAQANCFLDENGKINLEQKIMAMPYVKTHQSSAKNQSLASKVSNNKKSVTFDSAVRSSDILSTELGSADPNCSLSRHSPKTSAPVIINDSYIPCTFGSFNSYNTNKFKTFLHPYSSSTIGISRPSLRHITDSSYINIPSCTTDASVSTNPNAKGTRDDVQTAGEIIDVALQKHKALVRSMMCPANPQPDESRNLFPRTGGQDLDLCSSSSVETSDSGHCGSDLDVSVSKAGV